MSFQDHFSAVSKSYQQYRPTYPDELFYHLSHVCQEHTCAWDCATGTGQSARALAPYFDRVIATDGSEAQVLIAQKNQNQPNAKNGPESKLEFKTATAEHSGLADHSVDLITVSQAVHWFDLQAFATEVRRVLKPTGVLAIWCYSLLSIENDIDALVNHFYYDVVGPYWPIERKLVENGYQDIQLPFKEIPVPNYAMQASWNLPQLLGYLSTWSALRLYIEEQGTNPLDTLTTQLEEVWGDHEQIRAIHWPLSLRIWQL